ncbi:methionine aminotransferase [Pseudoalteromonas sp. CST5]|uniref:methionine aminotransferase n=1 Tax=unclassified Pseudoalteromonas TaxID=194690 RepID=UPI002358BB61|nr:MULTISPECIES: methionine aminotransferase [unclassified Pseudoalteromonas]MDC9514276.1 methionine aminotransferase [Pseudoalteromonas sp. CST1]MDC9538624.1 methionine aminotransferase [Pseudoalteromonas sp. CST3]MDC9542839.1 methionine aminotransferase [Pseudoalteromonas sp. CST2]MDC9545536.1 methionine aminotransferase [Pseudoalteromonas sp. CST4]MDC9550373.1 methionine aminotransferase [Pseudoalteromonas sp. CST5]
MFESKLPNLSVSIFSQMSGLASQHSAINLSQGFPEFDAPELLKNQLNFYVQQGVNQYSPSSGVPRLQQQIANLVSRKYAANIDAAEQVTVTSGATEALFVAIQTIVRPDDEVIVFDPAYDSYQPAIELAGGKTVHIALHAPDYAIDWQTVRSAVSKNTRAIIINTPHNPSGKILKSDDINALKSLVSDHDLYVISDEVYEHITFDGDKHLSMLCDEQLREKSFVISSFGKTFHSTGWKMGYCIAPAPLATEFRKIHQYVTFSSFTPAQHALADMLEQQGEHVDELSNFYQQKRDLLTQHLSDSRFNILPSQGTYFLLLDYSEVSDLNDVDFCHWLVEQAGVAAIPLSVFYKQPSNDKVIRLCFAKNDETLIEAAQILCQL